METQTLLKIKERAAAINYSDVSVNELGQLSERKNLLDERIVEGYGFVWGKKNTHNEIFHRGAFLQSIGDNGPGSGANYEIKLRDEHGRACALFEVLKEDDKGLYFRSKPLDSVTWCDDLLTQLRSGTINNFSGGFNYIFNDLATKYNNETKQLDIYEAKLFEISAVAVPSDLETFRVRSIEPGEMYDKVEDFIRGLPRKNQLEARHLFAQYKALEIEEPQERNHALDNLEPQKTAIDYNYIINNL